MEKYIQQFVGEDVVGTRFRTRHVHRGGSSGFVYDCITAQEALDKSRLRLEQSRIWWERLDIFELIEIFDASKGSSGERTVAKFTFDFDLGWLPYGS